MWPLNGHLRPLSGYYALFTVPTIVVLDADNELLSKALAKVHSIFNQQE